MSSSEKQPAVMLINPWAENEPGTANVTDANVRTASPSAYKNTTSSETTTTPTAALTPDTTGNLSSNNPFRKASLSQPSKNPTIVSAHARKPSIDSTFSSHARKPSAGGISSSHLRNPSTGGSPHRHPLHPTGMEKFPTLQSHHRRDGSLSNIDDDPLPSARAGSPRRSQDHGSPKTRPRRVSSLQERFPGDTSIHPLDILRDEAKAAHRSPHLRKQHLPGPDAIDRLDIAALKGYHHEGPYDAALLARNTERNFSPVAALSETTREALKATPRENVVDSLERHRPLDGVAVIPPGHRDDKGRLYMYEEGTDMMREPGADYKRWPGIDYHPDDLKGKGEPAFSIERALKDHKKPVPTDGTYIELVDRPRHNDNTHPTKSTSGVSTTRLGNSSPTDRTGSPSSSSSTSSSGPRAVVASSSSVQPHESYADWETTRRLSRSGSQRVSGEFKRRFGSLRGRKEGATGAAA